MLNSKEEDKEMSMDEILASIRRYVSPDAATSSLSEDKNIPNNDSTFHKNSASAEKNDYSNDLNQQKSNINEYSNVYAKHTKDETEIPEAVLAESQKFNAAENIALVNKNFAYQSVKNTSDGRKNREDSPFESLEKTVQSFKPGKGDGGLVGVSQEIEGSDEFAKHCAIVMESIVGRYVQKWLDDNMMNIVKKMIAVEIDRIKKYRN